MTAAAFDEFQGINKKEYDRRVWSWAMYDWASSAFSTTILAAVLPIYFSQVAGANLPSPAIATSYWSFGLSLSLFIVAILSPLLGTISDVIRGRKLFLAIFAGLGIVTTALLVLVTTGDWVLASILGILGRIGFNGAITFFDALLPHVAREGDRDRVSTLGIALGFLGGGILLAINVVMIWLLPGTWGPRLSFLSVALWWAIFSIPILRNVPEPSAAPARLQEGKNILTTSFKRLGQTLKDVRQYRQLFTYLLAFFVYNDGIGTIISVAAIYGAELGFGSVELILALLLVQFAGIPYSLIFGQLPDVTDKRRPIYLAFIIFNVIALPVVGVWSAHNLPANLIGARPPPYLSTDDARGEGLYKTTNSAFKIIGAWQTGQEIIRGAAQDAPYLFSADRMGRIDFKFNGQMVKISYKTGPDHGIWVVYIDNQPLIDPDTRQPALIDAYSPSMRYNVSQVYQAAKPGEHIFSLRNTDQKNPASQGNVFTLESLQVLPGIRQSNLLVIIGLILAIELVGGLFAFLTGRPFFTGLAQLLDTKRTIMVALLIYVVIAIWGYFLNSVIEFWFLAWMIAVVQGGGQALSRSLYAALSPAAKSGEFFGLFSVMEKFSAILGPLLFATAGVLLGSSRPAVLGLVILFGIGALLLSLVDVQEGKLVANRVDAALMAVPQGKDC